MRRLFRLLVPATPAGGAGCVLVLFVSGIALLTLWSALPGSPA
jgi:hypothetical protein